MNPTLAPDSTENDSPIADQSSSFESLERQVQQLTEQLRESRAAENLARDNCDRQVQMCKRVTDRFLLVERAQLDQLRHLLSFLAVDQQEIVTGKRNEDPDRPTSALSRTSPFYGFEQNDADRPTESDWDALIEQISEVMDQSKKFAEIRAEYIEQNNRLRLLNNQHQEELTKLLHDLSQVQGEHQKEQQARCQFEKKYNDVYKVMEQDQSKRLQKLRNYATLADDEGDILLSSLMRKAEKNDSDFREMRLQYETVFVEQTKQIKQLVKERESMHTYIGRLETENASLAAITTDSETVRLLTHASRTPTTSEEAWSLIGQLREEIVQQVKLRDKLRHEVQQLLANHRNDLRERAHTEHLLSRNLSVANDQIASLGNIQGEYQRMSMSKNDLDRAFDACRAELQATKDRANEWKEQLDQVTREREKIEEDNAMLRVQIQKVRADFENSESVQHDFVKLSQSLQVQLEEIRNSGTELRWRPEEDFQDCQRCHASFSVTWRKHHCRHCGKVLCKDCTSKTVYTGPNQRPSRVCDVCYTLLVRDSQPYFLSGSTSL